MILKDTMTYLESESSIMFHTPCEICGGNFYIEELYVEYIYDSPYHLCVCTCEDCGNEKVFLFSAPYLQEDLLLPPSFLLH